LGASNDEFEYISKWRLAIILDFCITWSFQKTTVGQNRQLDPKNLRFDTNINILGELVVKI